MQVELIFSTLVDILSSPYLLLLMVIAVPIGAFFGVLPGLGGKLGIVLLIPFVFGMDPTAGVVFLLAMHSVVHTGGAIDDEHGGWARLFRGVAESLVQARDDHRAAREATERLSDRYQRLLAQDERNDYIHLREARVVAAGASSLPVAGMHWRGRLSEVSGWSFGHLRPEPPAVPGPSDA